MHSSDQASPCHHPPPSRRSSAGKRRLPTSRTTAGVTSAVTSNKVTTMTTGTDSATTIIGAISVRNWLAPTDSSHCSRAATSDQRSSVPRTMATALSQ